MRKSKTIQMKLTRAFCAVVVCALLVANISVYIYLRQIYNRELVDNYKNIGENITEHIENSAVGIENFAKMICVDINLQDLMRKRSRYDGYLYYRNMREITSSLLQYVALRDDLIDDIYMIDRDGHLISRNNYYEDTLQSEWFEEIREQNTGAAFSELHEVGSRETNYFTDKKKVISYVVTMYDLNRPMRQDGFLGYIVINIKYAELIKEIGSFPDFRCTIYDNTGRVVESTEDSENILTVEESRKQKAGVRSGRYYFDCAIPTLGWQVVFSVDRSVISVQILYVVLLAFLITFVIMLVAGRVIAILSRNITGPLKILTDAIHQFSEGDYHTQVSIQSGDEIEEIADVFNQMVESIHRQMEENHRKEKEKRKSQMRFLIAQIKPHFIYNSLNCIIYLARKGKNEDIVLFTRALISLLQVSIKTKPQDKNFISSEIEYLNYYITLIRYRYENELIFENKIDEECCNLTLPGLILQPIVENSIFHGLLSKTDTGYIALSVKKEEQMVKIMVEDNGCGIPAERLAEIREKLLENKRDLAENENIGLENVSNRLKLCYGEKSGLHIESEEGKGTRVWFLVEFAGNME